MRKKKIVLNTAGMVESPKEKDIIIVDYSAACVGCVYSSHPRECLIHKCKYRPKLTNK